MEDLALAVGDGRVTRGKSIGIISGGAGDGEGIPVQRKQGGRETLLGTTYGSIGQLPRTAFCVETYAQQRVVVLLLYQVGSAQLDFYMIKD